ncbi:uncharacterized protein [Panulirus ornatus]|uniref:uncharacterized protein isoform X2 n=1 Tax=Panulirus ornatus TaxID=150431 RepID=UPI003A8B30C2
MLNLLAQQFRRYPVSYAAMVLRVLDSHTNNIVNLQRKWFEATSLKTQEKAQSSHYLRSWYSIIYHYYGGMTSHKEAKKFVYNFPKIRTVLKLQLDEILSLFQCQGYSWEEVQECKEMLLLPPSQFKERLQLLNEFAIAKPTLYQVAKRHQFPQPVIEEFLVLYMGNESAPLKDIYFFLLKHYLSLRFSSDVGEMELLFKRQRVITWKALAAYPQICDVIIHSLSLDFSTVLSKPLLLNIDPVKVKELLEKYPHIGSSSTVDIIKEFPKFALLPLSKTELWLRLLQKYKVTKFKFTSDVFRLFKSNAFRDVEERLQALSRLPEWQVICLSERLFTILQYPRYLKNLLSVSESGEDISSLASAMKDRGEGTVVHHIQRISSEMCVYVAHELDIKETEARELLQEDYIKRRGMAHVKLVLNLLFDFGFTREQVINGIIILNFDLAAIEQGLLEFPIRPEAQPFDEWMENPFVVHLLVYCMKKDVPLLDLLVKE